MGGLNFLGLNIEGPGIYFGGQTVNGQVIVDASEEQTNIKSVEVKLKGKGEVHFTETVTKYRTNDEGQRESYQDTDHFRNKETYLKTKVLLHAGNVHAGRNVYPFTFLLPGNLPCSFEGRHGNVRYQLQAKLDRSGFLTFDKKKKHFITVNSLVDLNQMPSITQPASFSDTKTFGCLCCTSGPLTSSVYLPRVGYAPGEGIPVSAEVENLSNKTMNKTQAKLIQDIVFRGHCEFQERSKHITRIIQEVKRGEIEPGSSETWEAVNVNVPAVPPTGLGGNCSIMDVSYRLEFHVDPSGIGFDLVNKIPITIGTIPLRAVFQTWPTYTPNAAPYIPPPSADEEKLGWVAPSAPPIPLDGYGDLPPPTYSQAISADEGNIQGNNLKRDKDSGEGIEGNWDYHPIYPVWPSAPPPPTAE